MSVEQLRAGGPSLMHGPITRTIHCLEWTVLFRTHCLCQSVSPLCLAQKTHTLKPEYITAELAHGLLMTSFWPQAGICSRKSNPDWLGLLSRDCCFLWWVCSWECVTSQSCVSECMPFERELLKRGKTKDSIMKIGQSTWIKDDWEKGQHSVWQP